MRLLLLLLLFVLLLLLFSEFDERLVLDNLLPNKLDLVVGVVAFVDKFNIDDCDEGEPVSITCTKFEGNTPILPFSLPFHQPIDRTMFVIGDQPKKAEFLYSTGC